MKTIQGNAAAMNGEALLIDLGSDGLLTLNMLDTKERWALYYKKVKITIEVEGPMDDGD